MENAGTAAATEKRKKRAKRDNSRDSLRQLPKNWREVAIQPTASKSQKAIASALAMIEDGESAICNNPTCAGCQQAKAEGKTNTRCTVADHKYGIGYHSRERAAFIVKTSPAWTRKLWFDETKEPLEKVHRFIRADVERDSFDEESTKTFIRKRAFDASEHLTIVRFFNMLSLNSLSRAWKAEAALLHPDVTAGDDTRITELNEVWTMIEGIKNKA
jgi:hypothetical protein